MAVYAGIPPALLTLGICLYQLSLPHVLYGVHEYDDGVYIGSALRLVHGVIPYRDFVIVHPPGIVLLMSPLAALSGLIGTGAVLGLARDVTVLVAALNALLASVAVRHRGPWAGLVAATALACFPMAPAADSTLFLEPYLVMFCLVGVIVMFRGGRLASRRRVLLAGVAFGFAGAVKVWAAFVIAAAVLLCARRVRDGLIPVLLGATAGFALPCLPFFAMAPYHFVRDVFGDQLERVVSGAAVFSWDRRIRWLTGMPGLTLFRAPAALAVAVAAAFLALCVWIFGRHRRRTLPADWMVVLAAAASVSAMWAPDNLYAHYMYFPAPFLGALLAVCLAIARDVLSSRTPTGGVWYGRGLALAGAALVVFLVPQQAGYARSNLAVAKSATFLNFIIPPDSCVLSDDSVVAISADLFEPYRRGCPQLVDAFGTWLADGPPVRPSQPSKGAFTGVYHLSFSPSFVNEWARWLSEADWVLQLSKTSSYVPWTAPLRAWFAQDFELVTDEGSLWVYRHVRYTPPPVMAAG